MSDEAGEEKLHYHAFSFISGGMMSQTYACVYMGWPDRNVPPSRIQEAKKGAEVPSDAVLIGLSYLGLMTRADAKR